MARVNGLVLKMFREQNGLVSRQQALNAGLSEKSIDKRLRRGDWDVAASGVYRLPGTPETWWQRAAAVCLQGAPHTALSHQSAAYFHKLDGFETKPPKVIQVTIPHGKRLVPPPNVEILRARRPGVEFYRHRGGASATSLQRTLVDLASHVTIEKLDVALDSACRKSSEFEPLLRRVVEGLNPRAYPGLGALRELLTDRQTTDSALEVEVRRLSWAAGLPTPQIHFNVCHGDRWIGEVDFAWVDEKVCIPAQSLLFHTKPKRFYRDAEQLSELVAAGWSPLPTTKRDVLRTPARFIARLQETWERAKRRRLYEGPGEGEPSRR